MPTQVRIIRQKNSSQWDDILRSVINAGAYEQESIYHGISNQARADEVRRRLRTAGGHLGVGRKVFYFECPNAGNCPDGGPDCAYHVSFTLYDLQKARDYKAQQASKTR